MSEDGELAESPQTTEQQQQQQQVDEEDNEHFIIDKNCSGIIPNEELEKEIPSAVEEEKPSEWQKKMRKRMLGEPPSPEEEPQNKRRRMNACFNCKGDHTISQCPDPKDFARIRKNKMEFMNEKQPTNGGRISKIQENESKFKPGRLSQTLRNALNLGPDDIPEWVYRMRRMGFYQGYPPGYLRKSLKIEHETIKIYSEETNDQDDEEQEKPKPAPTVQENLVHFYMGFNKTYGALRDRERGMFEVPPFDTFCKMLQTEVTEKHAFDEKYRLREDRLRRVELRKLREEQKKQKDDDMEKKNETEGDDDVFLMDRKKTTEIVEISREKTPDLVEIDGKMGESISQLVGTPIVSRRDESGIWRPESIPSLEAFAVGIVPFEAKEEDKATGIFKKIMSTLRGDNNK